MLNTMHTVTTNGFGSGGFRSGGFRGPRTMAGEFASSLWMLLLGIFIGALFMAMFLGFRSGSDSRIGAGIRDVVSNRPSVQTATNSPNPPAPTTTVQSVPRQPAPQTTVVSQPRMSETIVSSNPAPAPRTQRQGSTVTFHEVLSQEANVLPQPVVRQPLPETSVAPKPSTPEDRNINTTASYSETMRSVSGSYYMLQVGSFQRYEEADRLKAQLTMAGLTPTIREATVRGTRVYRVRVGPYGSYDDLGIVESRVRRLGHQPIQVKVSQN